MLLYRGTIDEHSAGYFRQLQKMASCAQVESVDVIVRTPLL